MDLFSLLGHGSVQDDRETLTISCKFKKTGRNRLFRSLQVRFCGKHEQLVSYLLNIAL